MDDVLTVAELAARLRLGRRATYEAIARGEVPGVIRIGHAIRLSASAIDHWIRTGARDGHGPAQPAGGALATAERSAAREHASPSSG